MPLAISNLSASLTYCVSCLVAPTAESLAAGLTALVSFGNASFSEQGWVDVNASTLPGRILHTKTHEAWLKQEQVQIMKHRLKFWPSIAERSASALAKKRASPGDSP